VGKPGRVYGVPVLDKLGNCLGERDKFDHLF
jgi:hypothetical protein